MVIREACTVFHTLAWKLHRNQLSNSDSGYDNTLFVTCMDSSYTYLLNPEITQDLCLSSKTILDSLIWISEHKSIGLSAQSTVHLYVLAYFFHTVMSNRLDDRRVDWLQEAGGEVQKSVQKYSGRVCYDLIMNWLKGTQVSALWLQHTLTLRLKAKRAFPKQETIYVLLSPLLAETRTVVMSREYILLLSYLALLWPQPFTGSLGDYGKLGNAIGYIT